MLFRLMMILFNVFHHSLRVLFKQFFKNYIVEQMLNMLLLFLFSYLLVYLISSYTKTITKKSQIAFFPLSVSDKTELNSTI